MTSKNLSFLIYGKNDLRFDNLPTPEPSEDEVVLRMSHVGLCGSEKPVIARGADGPLLIKSPAVMGHEGSGVVAKCGSKVTSLKPGDRVAVEPAIPCLLCEFCKKGQPNVCPNLKGNLPPSNGMLQHYYKHRAEWCHKLPDNVSLEEGAMMEPLSVTIFACQRANLTPASRVLILGAGSIGLTLLQVVKSMGATQLCVLDISDRKLQIAKSLGATATINAKSVKESDIEDLVKDKMNGTSPDITFECTGTEPALRMGVLSTAPYGKVVVVGVPGSDEVKVPMFTALHKHVNIIMSYLFPNCFERAQELMASGKLNLGAIVTHRFKFGDAPKAYDTLMKGTEDPVKIMVSCQ